MAVNSVLDRITSLSDGMDDNLRMVVYGRSGTGKTTLWATFPKPILAIVCSGSRKPGELRSIRTTEYEDSIRKVVLHSSDELPILAEHARENYATVVLDHVTGYQDLILAEILGRDTLPEQKTWGLATQQQYGQLAIQCKERLKVLLDLECNVVVVGQERGHNTDTQTVADSATGARAKSSAGSSDILLPFVSVALTPSLIGWLNHTHDYVVQTYLREPPPPDASHLIGGGKNGSKPASKKDGITMKARKKVEYCLRTGADPIFMTKFRVPKGTPLPDSIVDPSYEAILALSRGEWAE